MVNKYLNKVVETVMVQPKPTETGFDYIKVMTTRAEAAIKSVVPGKYRLAVRMALIKYAGQAKKLAQAV